MTYSEELRHELATVGIDGRLRARIVAEIDDHLACDPQAQLGAPALLARQFADQLGTVRARRAATWSFAALALAGLLFGVAFLVSPAAAFGAAPPHAPLLGRLARIVAVLAPQVAFAAGLLAALRAVQRRRQAAIAALEARVLVRRAAVGVTFGVATMLGLAGIALEFQPELSGAWYEFALIAAGIGTAALLATVPVLVAAMRLRPVAPGSRGDVFDDLGWLPVPDALRGRPWRLALLVAAGVAVAVAIAGVLGDDPYDGIARGVFDGLACLFGFATLGRYLGLWSRRAQASLPVIDGA